MSKTDWMLWSHEPPKLSPSQASRHGAAGRDRINCRPQALIAAFTVV